MKCSYLFVLISVADDEDKGSIACRDIRFAADEIKTQYVRTKSPTADQPTDAKDEQTTEATQESADKKEDEELESKEEVANGTSASGNATVANGEVGGKVGDGANAGQDVAADVGCSPKVKSLHEILEFGKKKPEKQAEGEELKGADGSGEVGQQPLTTKEYLEKYPVLKDVTDVMDILSGLSFGAVTCKNQTPVSPDMKEEGQNVGGEDLQDEVD